MERGRAVIKTLVFTVFVPGSVAGVVPRWLLKAGQHARHDVFGAAGVLAIVAGAIIYVLCAWEFAYRGLGTPAPIDPPKALVSRGLHKFVRNPMYVGVFLAIVGQAALFHSAAILIYAAFFLTAAHSFVLLYEEPALRRKFGSSYEEYLRSVPRWIPRL